MTTLTPSLAAVQSARRFIGRRAAACRKHGDPDQQHHVNRMGGLVCSECHPPRTDADCVVRLVIRGGLWDDADNPFDFQGGEIGEIGRAAKTVARSGTAAPNSGSVPNTNIDEATTSDLATTRDRKDQPTSRRVGEPLLDLELDFFLNWDASYPELISAREIGRSPADRESQKESQSERERSGLLESGALGSGSGFRAVPLQEPTISTQFAVGQVVRLLRRLETFRGFIGPCGGLVISSVGKDSTGWPLVALSRDGEVVVSGLVLDVKTVGPVLDLISADELLA